VEENSMTQTNLSRRLEQNMHRTLAERFLQAKRIPIEGIRLGYDSESLLEILVQFTEITGRELQATRNLLEDTLIRAIRPPTIIVDKSAIRLGPSSIASAAKLLPTGIATISHR
jgi:hypothetical protein